MICDIYWFKAKMYVVVKNFIIELSETGWRQHKLLIHVDPLILKKKMCKFVQILPYLAGNAYVVISVTYL